MPIDWSKFLPVDGQARWMSSSGHPGFLEISSPHALSQAVGYAKYQLGADGHVYYRGQNKYYPGMRPSLYRGVATFAGCNERASNLLNEIARIAAQDFFLTNTPGYAYEPLLQHYGFKTRWLDVVDNVWSSLWFACHKAISSDPHGEFIHYERSPEEYGFIYLMQFGSYGGAINSGHWLTDEKFEVVDLRVAAPSLYLRPHSQHGLLAMRKSTARNHDTDYADRVVGVFGIPVKLGLGWLGEGFLSATHFMFPPVKYDLGYRCFVNKKLPPSGQFGCISFIGA